MPVSSINNNLYSFKARQNTNLAKNTDENPISKAGEKAILVKSAFAAGAALGGKLLLELLDGDTVAGIFDETSKKIVSRQKKLSKPQRVIKELGVFAGLTGLFVLGFAALYTLYKAPSINYNGNINAFTKGKDMDVYIKTNAVEKELYTQMNEKAKNADASEKQKLREQYMQLRAAKNQVPQFLNVKY